MADNTLWVELERNMKFNESFKGLLQKKKGKKIGLVAILNVWDEYGKLKDLEYVNLKPISNEEVEN